MSATPKRMLEELDEDVNVNLDAKTRQCLMCSTPFPSQWAGERVCPKCKSSSTWRSG